MAHWEHRTEPKWASFQFNQPYAKGLKRLREEVLAMIRQGRWMRISLKRMGSLSIRAEVGKLGE